MKTISWAHEDIAAMQTYHWPGNIRELKNMMERCILLGKPPADYWREMQAEHSGIPVAQTAVETTSTELPQGLDDPQPLEKQTAEFVGELIEAYPLDWPLKEVEKVHIQKVVNAHDGNKSAAARQLGVARKTLERKYKEWSEEPKDKG